MKNRAFIDLATENLAKFLSNPEQAQEIVSEICTKLDIDPQSTHENFETQNRVVDALIERGGKMMLVGRSLKIKLTLGRI